MSWNTYISSGGIKSYNFASHAKAVAHFNAVKPIRGRIPELKPLGSNRSYTQCKITNDALVDSISAELYGRPCVTIYPDNTIKITSGGWVGPATAMFIDAVLPYAFGQVRLSKRRLIYTAPQGQGNTPAKTREFAIPESGLWLKLSANWETAEPIIADNAPTLYEYKADRKVMNAIRKNIKPFLDAQYVMTSMSTTYDTAEIAYFYPHVVDTYIDRVNEHKANMKLKEEGNVNAQNYYGYFFSNSQFAGIVEKNVGAPQMYNLSGIADRVKNIGGENTRKLTNNPYGTPNYEDAYRVEDYLAIIADLFSDDAETVRKVMLSVVTNSSNGAREWRDKPEIPVTTMFGEVMIPNMNWVVSGTTIENYIIEVIKYVYADLIFKKVEVPQGVLPSTYNEKYMLCNKYLVEQEDILTRRKVVI